MKMATYRKLRQYFTEAGDRDARQGLPIDSYYKTKLPRGVARHNERWRAIYEMGYRWAVDAMRKAAKHWDFENRQDKSEKVAAAMDATENYEGTPWINLVDCADEALDEAITKGTSKDVRVLAKRAAVILAEYEAGD